MYITTDSHGAFLDLRSGIDLYTLAMHLPLAAHSTRPVVLRVPKKNGQPRTMICQAGPCMQ